MNNSVEGKINSLKERLESKKNERNRAEANFEVADMQLKDVVSQIKGNGYEPEQLPQVIADLEKNIMNNLSEAERILNEAEPITTNEVLGRVGLQ